MLKLGAHVSAAGGYAKAVERIAGLGGNALQIFAASPRGWNFAKISDEEKELFLKAKKKLGVPQVYFHASYLINFADGSQGGHLSKKSLIAELKVAGDAGVVGSIVHLGSFKNGDSESADPKHFGILLKNIKAVLAATPPETLFIIENAGNRKIGRRLEEIGRIIREIDDKRLRVCLDTCHLHAAGYNLRGPENFENFLKNFDEIVGLNRLEVIHLNDSRDLFGSLRDRHENIGKGSVGEEVFRSFLTHSKTRELSFITEVPGFDGLGPDKKNLDILKSLVGTDMK